jgi:hypothetical protein
VPAPPGTAPSSTECSSRADSLSEGAQEAVQRALRGPVQRVLRRPVQRVLRRPVQRALRRPVQWSWSVVSGQWSWSVVSGQWSVVSGQWSVVSGRGQWSVVVVSGQWSVVSGQWSVVVVSGQWSVVSGQWSVVRAPCPPSGGLIMRRLYYASPRKSAQGRRASMAERTYGRRSGWTTDHRLPEETMLYMAGAHGGARHGVE